MWIIIDRFGRVIGKAFGQRRNMPHEKWILVHEYNAVCRMKLNVDWLISLPTLAE